MAALDLQLFIVALVLCLLGSSDCATRQTVALPWLSYWHQKLPGVQAPKSISALSSPLTQAETGNFVNKLQEGSLASGSKILCTVGNLPCDEKVTRGPIVCVAPYFYDYGTAKCKADIISSSNAMVSDVFFEPAKLSVGDRIVYPRLANDLQGRRFLPGALAKVMPFSTDKLSESLIVLNVPSGSNMAVNMERTLSFCGSQAPEGEVRTCHSSIESMVDFAASSMGSELAVFSPEYVSTQSEAVRILDTSILSSSERKSMTCHDLMYPYLVYGCHVMGSSQILDVKMEREAGGDAFHGAAVCHTETSSWNEDHPAFAALGVRPGESSICHWVPENNFMWIHAQ